MRIVNRIEMGRGKSDQNSGRQQGRKEVDGSSQGNAFSKENRYEVRRDLSEMLDRTIDEQENLLDLKECRLKERLQEIDTNFKKVKDTSNGLIDCKIVSVASNVCREQSKQLSSGSWNYRSGDVDDTIVSFYNEHEALDAGLSHPGFERLQKDVVLLLAKQVPAFRPIFGSFEPGERARVEQRQRQARRRGPNSTVLTQPEQLTEAIDKSAGGETIVEHINRKLESLYIKHDKKPISYFDFVLHPSSFAQTVENIFHVAFLVKDLKIKLYMGPDGLPYVEPVKKQKSRKDEPGDGRERTQFIMTISQEEWELLVKAYGIKEPLLNFVAEIHLQSQRSRAQ